MFCCVTKGSSPCPPLAMRVSFLASVVFVVIGVSATPILNTPLKRDAVDFYDPRKGGGSQLDESAGAGEPLNVSTQLPRFRFSSLNKI
jgi:hypothetical protein